MRIVAEIPHPQTKITVFSWNNRYLIKFEFGFLEQTYKIAEMDLTSEADLEAILSEAFIATVMKRFKEMAGDFGAAVRDAGI